MRMRWMRMGIRELGRRSGGWNGIDAALVFCKINYEVLNEQFLSAYTSNLGVVQFPWID